MPGSYCHYCGDRCFVEGTVFVDGKRLVVNHWATCKKGVAHDREATLRKHGVAIDHHIALDMGAPVGDTVTRATVQAAISESGA